MCDRHLHDDVDLEVLVDGAWTSAHLIEIKEVDPVWGTVEIVACWTDGEGHRTGAFPVGHVRPGP